MSDNESNESKVGVSLNPSWLGEEGMLEMMAPECIGVSPYKLYAHYFYNEFNMDKTKAFKATFPGYVLGTSYHKISTFHQRKETRKALRQVVSKISKSIDGEMLDVHLWAIVTDKKARDCDKIKAIELLARMKKMMDIEQVNLTSITISNQTIELIIPEFEKPRLIEDNDNVIDMESMKDED